MPPWIFCLCSRGNIARTHGALHSPLGEVLLILSVERQGKIVDHRTQEFLDGLFHPAHPRVVALLTNARQPDFLVFGDFGRRSSDLATERLPSLDSLENPTRKQILSGVDRITTENARVHGWGSLYHR